MTGLNNISLLIVSLCRFLSNQCVLRWYRNNSLTVIVSCIWNIAFSNNTGKCEVGSKQLVGSLVAVVFRVVVDVLAFGAISLPCTSTEIILQRHSFGLIIVVWSLVGEPAF